MRKNYDDFAQLKIKDMSKSISDMTYQYLNPETNIPTKVPATHYESILNQVAEKYMSDVTSRQFLSIMFTQLSNLKKEDEKYFNEALLCIDLGLNPKDLRLNEFIGLEHTNKYMDDKKAEEKKNYHFLSDDVVETFEKSKNEPELHSKIIREFTMLNEKENNSSEKNWER